MGNRKISWGLCLGLAVVLLAGCGGRHTGISNRGTVSGGVVSAGAVSGGAVSEGAVSGGAIEEKRLPISSEKKNRYNWFYSDTCFYYSPSGYGAGEFVEHNLADGTNRRVVRKNLWQLCYVDKEGVYYVVEAARKKESDILYRAPIEDGRVNIEKEKALFSTEDGFFSDIYFDGRYLFYESDIGEYHKYDLKKKREIKSIYNDDYEDSAVLSIVDGYIYFRHEGGEDKGFYRQKMDSGKVTKITGKSVWGTAMAVMGENVYYAEEYAEPFCIRKYHLGDGSKKVAVSEKQIEEMFRENNLPDGTGPDPSKFIRYDELAGLFVCGDRLYIQMTVMWEDKNGPTDHKNIVFYLEPGKDETLHYAKEITECMLYERPYSDYIMKYYSRGRCVEMTEEKCYMEIYNPQTDKNTLGCYDFKSGEFKYLTDRDMEWYLSYYVAPHRLMERVWEDLPGFRDADWDDTDMYP